ncbi:hypothetical protein BDV96DRAFT_149178 [Lophiotrema nucula]|uniref:Uncharacterized protein n=1 Tax=Lophiotrema nucula TaxID=690887 RepID=A0A6A5Z3X3_9PLEO|nr:hypothetical protein BDV96DRAFT_149178 [Lophiotrema nucula]
MPSTTTTPHPFSPTFPFFSLSAKGLSPINTSFPLSYERTKIQELPFPHPKYHVRPSTGEIYETSSPILEGYDPVSGYIEDRGEATGGYVRDGEERERLGDVEDGLGVGVGGDIRQSIETDPGDLDVFTSLARDVVRDSNLHNFASASYNNLHLGTRFDDKDFDWEKWSEVGSGFGDGGWEKIEWPENSEKEIVTREAKRGRDGPLEGEFGVRRDKRVRERR